METIEPLINKEHLPHVLRDKGFRFLARRLLKDLLYLLVFALAFHLPDYSPNTLTRQETIQGIVKILDREGVDIQHVSKEALAEAIYEEATRYNHDPKFIVALIAIESSFRNASVSRKGAKGLMQLMPYVAEAIAPDLGIKWGGDRTLFDPFLNIKLGSYYLSRLIDDFKNPKLALTAYNYGPTYIRSLVDSKKRLPLHYYRRVLAYYQTI
jgi:soluble lytic murein transglycosylase